MNSRHESRAGTQLPTSFDVARRAGVSQSTVSLVLNGKAAGRVSARTQEAVLRVAQELGYQIWCVRCSATSAGSGASQDRPPGGAYRRGNLPRAPARL